jgi:hypothetical protein
MTSKEDPLAYSPPAFCLIGMTKSVLTKLKANRNVDRLSGCSTEASSCSINRSESESLATVLPDQGRLPPEIYEQIFSHIGIDIPLLPPKFDGIHTLNHYYSYFELVDDQIRTRNSTLASCRLVSSTWKKLATSQLNRYLIFRNNKWKDHNIWRYEAFRRQVRHVWITPQAVNEDIFYNPSHGIFALILTGFPNLETLHASFPGCYEAFYCAQFLRLHVPRSLKILGINGPVSGSFLNPSHIRAELQINILRLFPNLETFFEVEGTPHLVELAERVVLSFIGCSIKMRFGRGIEPAYFSQLQTLSLTGGHILQDGNIMSFIELCPPIKQLRIRGFDSGFTMNGMDFSIKLSNVGLERLLDKVGTNLDSLHLAIRQSDSLWGDGGPRHLCPILARTCHNVRVLWVGEEDSFAKPLRSTSCCRELFELAAWENLVDCYLCLYPGRGGCLDWSEGSLNALVESARGVAFRNSKGLGTIIRIKGLLVMTWLMKLIIC